MTIDTMQLKRDMVRHAKTCGESVPVITLSSPTWGLGARRLAWRITSKHLPKPTTSAQAVYNVLNPPIKPAIIPLTFAWAHPLVHRDGPPKMVVLHHAAAKTCTPQQIHKWHLENGWSGFGYHFMVRKDGKIYRGRPIWAMGAHARGYNDAIGVVAEGNFELEFMPDAQRQSLQQLVKWLRSEYPGITFKRHRDVNATACPGRNYPLTAILGKG